MTPAARIAAAIGILDDWGVELDRLGDEAQTLSARLALWARQNRYAGARDRAAIGDLVHDVVRRRRSLAALWSAFQAGGADFINDLGEPQGRGLMLAALVRDGASVEDIAALFSGTGYGPSPLGPAEQEAITRLADATEREALLNSMTAAVRCDWPDWLWDDLAAASPDAEADACALSMRAAFDLRVNRNGASTESALAALEDDGLAAEAAPLSPIGLRVADHRRIGRSQAFLGGLVEPQDVASQASALLAAHALAGNGMPGAVIDFCAGGGGKTLALAAEALPSGPLEGRRLIAHDVEPRRMADLPDRLARAGAMAERLSTNDLAALEGLAALVLVDAPCSGSGAWARETEAKWRLGPQRLDRYVAAQREALVSAARLTRPGGVLVYVTCSVLNRENQGAVTWFARAEPGFEPLDIAPAWRSAGIKGDPAPGSVRQFSPARDDCGGFFIAMWRRQSGD